MQAVKAEFVGDVALIVGHGFRFEKVGDLAVFKQVGKIPSIRTAKVVCKAISRAFDSMKAA